MVVKVFFVGNVIKGDDGIGPALYNELKDSEELKHCELIELGVLGLDLISLVSDDDMLIIVDALYSAETPGKVLSFSEDMLSKELSFVSVHDFGVEQTVALLRSLKPSMKKVSVIGITVAQVEAVTDKLSNELTEALPAIKKDVVKKIIELIDVADVLEGKEDA